MFQHVMVDSQSQHSVETEYRTKFTGTAARFDTYVRLQDQMAYVVSTLHMNP